MDPSAASASVSSPNFYQCKYGRVQLLTAENYTDWSTTLTNFLKADRTWKIIQEIEKVPVPPMVAEAFSSSLSSHA